MGHKEYGPYQIEEILYRGRAGLEGIGLFEGMGNVGKARIPSA
jgi:hypothetical protein